MRTLRFQRWGTSGECLLLERYRYDTLVKRERFDEVDLTFRTEARICAVCCLGSRLSDLQFRFLVLLALGFGIGDFGHFYLKVLLLVLLLLL